MNDHVDGVKYPERWAAQRAATGTGPESALPSPTKAKEGEAMPETTTKTTCPNPRGDDWTRLGVLDYEAPDSQALIVGKDGNLWIAQRDGTNGHMLTPGEAVGLAQNLCEMFGLIVVNEPEAWGNDQPRCECDTVPARVLCLHCDAHLMIADPKRRPDWEQR